MQGLPNTPNAVVIRTDFGNQLAWKKICKLIRAPVPAFGDAFYANVEFIDDADFRNLSLEELLTRVPSDYNQTFLFVVDDVTISAPDFPILIVDLRAERGRSFRAIPGQVQSIENNLSIANRSFFEFADNVDQDGIFRGFPQP